MRDELVGPFDSIESALEFMVVLEKVISDASDELRGKLDTATTERYTNGLNLALYKMKQLSSHVQKSRRILNDLTLIRSVLVGDGIAKSEAAASQG
jgi:hypothetical protein